MGRDEQIRLDTINPDWFKQEKVSIRVQEILTLDSLEQIRQRILQEGRLHRQIHDLLGRTSGYKNAFS